MEDLGWCVGAVLRVMRIIQETCKEWGIRMLLLVLEVTCLTRDVGRDHHRQRARGGGVGCRKDRVPDFYPIHSRNRK